MICLPPKPRHARQGGFTLLEVIVAFAILSLAMGVLYQAYGASLQRSSQTGRQQEATLFAQSVIAQVRGDNPLRVGTLRGESTSGMKWTVDIQSYAPSEREANYLVARDGVPRSTSVPAFDVTVRVRWGTRESQVVELHSLELGSGS